jgi:hypothetical protein
MSIGNPSEHYALLSELEYFHMDREQLIFVTICRELTKRGKIQPFKAAHLAEIVETELLRWEKWQ